jgi:hypothetical protein
MISKCKFITEYKFKTIKQNTSKTGQFKKSKPYTPYEYEAMFTVEINDENAEINFNTGYGICFLHNIFTGGYELIDEDLYKLSENTQFVYRKIFFTYGTLPKVFIRMDRIFEFLNITTQNTTNRKKLFKKIINELSTVDRIQLKRKVNDECYEFSLGVKRKENKIIPLSPEIESELKEFQDQWDLGKKENDMF